MFINFLKKKSTQGYNLIQNFMEDYKEIRVKNDMLTLQGIAQYYINIENDNYKYETIKDILGGVRSSCTYVGAPSLKQLSKCTTFVRVTKQFNDTFVK